MIDATANLPPETKLYALRFCSQPSLLAVSQVSHDWRKAAKMDSRLCLTASFELPHTPGKSQEGLVERVGYAREHGFWLRMKLQVVPQSRGRRGPFDPPPDKCSPSDHRIWRAVLEEVSCAMDISTYLDVAVPYDLWMTTSAWLSELAAPVLQILRLALPHCQPTGLAVPIRPLVAHNLLRGLASSLKSVTLSHISLAVPDGPILAFRQVRHVHVKFSPESDATFEDSAGVAQRQISVAAMFPSVSDLHIERLLYTYSIHAQRPLHSEDYRRRIDLRGTRLHVLGVSDYADAAPTESLAVFDPAGQSSSSEVPVVRVSSYRVDSHDSALQHLAASLQRYLQESIPTNEAHRGGLELLAMYVPEDEHLAAFSFRLIDKRSGRERLYATSHHIPRNRPDFPTVTLAGVMTPFISHLTHATVEQKFLSSLLLAAEKNRAALRLVRLTIQLRESWLTGVLEFTEAPKSFNVPTLTTMCVCAIGKPEWLSAAVLLWIVKIMGLDTDPRRHLRLGLQGVFISNLPAPPSADPLRAFTEITRDSSSIEDDAEVEHNLWSETDPDQLY
ncbi:hypothetical protein BKA62DRAFT_830258 [Auriculariales sp. MPI-PUGE-AT-0066]|nr:hypothetical protein BKA62DRAFT_830258 [Auriculariales sp. MPI-PUGE-AT-0066]